MFTESEIKAANKTSRANGAVGTNAITPRYVKQYIDLHDIKQEATVLDFGAGKRAAHTQALQKQGYAVTAYEFGDNIDRRYHNELALTQKYDIVFASNVLNVQTSVEMAMETIAQIAGCVRDDCLFFANYPASPRKSAITPHEMTRLLSHRFSFVDRVSGSERAPLWKCIK